MADTVLTATAGAATDLAFGLWGPYWLDENVGARILLDSTNQPQAIKTLDAGSTNEAAQVVSGHVVRCIAAWFDLETPGRSGALVHTAWHCLTHSVFEYAQYSITNDSWGSVVDVQTATGADSSTDTCWVTVARNGYVKCGYTNGVTSGGYRSTDGGTSFGSRTDPFESSAKDLVLAVPANTGDDADVALIFWDIDANELSIKMEDDSGNSYTETVIASSMVDGAGVIPRQGDAKVFLSDGTVFLAAWSERDTATADLKTWLLTVDSIAAPTVTAKTNIITDTAESICAAVFIDQTNGDVYVDYAQGTAALSLVAVKRVESTDTGASWGSPTTVQEDVEGDMRLISLGGMGAFSGRVQEIWYNDDLDDVMYSLTNDIVIAALQPTYQMGMAS